MEFSSPSKSRMRGKPFKLFTDDLPKIEFNRSPHLGDFNRSHLGDFNNGPGVGKRMPFAQFRRQAELNSDRYSLPSLESPDLDGLASPEPRRPTSQLNVLHPNIAQLNKKIRRRHTVKEGRERRELDQRFRRAHAELPLKPLPDTPEDRAARFEETVKEAFVRTSSSRSVGNATRKGNDREDRSDPEKPKSIFQQLLDASARDSARRRLVEEGFKLFRQDGVKRRNPPGVLGDIQQTKPKKVSSDEVPKPKSNEHETVPDNKEDSKQNSSESVNVETRHLNDDDVKTVDGNAQEKPASVNSSEVKVKPGILKNNVGTRTTKIKHDVNLKPRLVHQDNIKDLPHDDVQVSVHADVPMNRLNALIFTRNDYSKPRTKRRVNFDRLQENGKPGHEESIEARQTKDIDLLGNDVDATDRLNGDNNIRYGNSGRQGKSILKKRESMRRKPRILVPNYNHTSSFPSQNKPARKQDSPSSGNALQFEKLTENLKDPRADPFWKEVKDPLLDIPPGLDETVNRKLEPGEVTNLENPHTSTIQSNLNRKGSKRTKGKITRRVQHVPNIYPPSDTVSTTPTTGSLFGNSDFDSMSDVQSFFDDFDVDGFPDEIDRSLIGEDLIKAYRLWDRKRKAFPGGLRKIEGPTESQEDYLLAKALSGVRTYRIPTQGQEAKSSENKDALTSVVIGTF